MTRHTETTTAPPHSRPLTAAVDTAAVVAFAVFGRLSHEGSLDVSGIARTAAPFLIALAATWLVLATPPFAAIIGGATAYRSGRFGVIAGLSTAVIGILLRRVLWDDGTALSFVIVTVLFITGVLFAWRLVANTKP